MIDSKYRPQVDLLLTLLPSVAKEETFALTGGTAINLFIRDLPRLSVDIDLRYLPLGDDRKTALNKIAAALDRIEANVKKALPDISLTRLPQKEGHDVKLNCQLGKAHVKVEINTITRGVLQPVKVMQVSDAVQAEFGKFAAIQVVPFGDLYGGKICAALDRQHPRDLFDISCLLKKEGITEEVKYGMIAFLLSHPRPIVELLNPHHKDLQHAFENQFQGMTQQEFSYGDYEATRNDLVKLVRVSLTEKDKMMLTSFEAGEPKWELYPYKDLRNLPAVQWKLQNIKKLAADKPEKHKEILKSLEVALA